MVWSPQNDYTIFEKNRDISYTFVQNEISNKSKMQKGFELMSNINYISNKPNTTYLYQTINDILIFKCIIWGKQKNISEYFKTALNI